METTYKPTAAQNEEYLLLRPHLVRALEGHAYRMRGERRDTLLHDAECNAYAECLKCWDRKRPLPPVSTLAKYGWKHARMGRDELLGTSGKRRVPIPFTDSQGPLARGSLVYTFANPYTTDPADAGCFLLAIEDIYRHFPPSAHGKIKRFLRGESAHAVCRLRQGDRGWWNADHRMRALRWTFIREVWRQFKPRD